MIIMVLANKNILLITPMIITVITIVIQEYIITQTIIVTNMITTLVGILPQIGKPVQVVVKRAKDVLMSQLSLLPALILIMEKMKKHTVKQHSSINLAKKEQQQTAVIHTQTIINMLLKIPVIRGTTPIIFTQIILFAMVSVRMVFVSMLHTVLLARIVTRQKCMNMTGKRVLLLMEQ